MTTGVPSGRRASVLSVRSVAWRQPALAGVPIALPGARRPVHREPVAAVPARRKPRLVPRDHDDAAAEAPARARDLVGDVEPAARRGRVARPDRHPPAEDDPAVLAQRQEPLGEIRLDAVAHLPQSHCRGHRHPADDAVLEHVALDREPVAAPLDDAQAPDGAERRLPARHGERPAGRRPADRDLRPVVDHERQRPARLGGRERQAQTEASRTLRSRRARGARCRRCVRCLPPDPGPAYSRSSVSAVVEDVVTPVGPVPPPPHGAERDLDGRAPRTAARPPRGSARTDGSSSMHRTSPPSERRGSCSPSTTTPPSSTPGSRATR